MESGGSSNMWCNYITRSPNSGIVLREPSFSTPSTDHNNVDAQQTFKRKPDQYVPMTNVTRIMRQVLPDNARIADDAKEMIQEYVSDFICVITNEASKKCHQECRRTIKTEDILSAMASLGLDNYVEALHIYLNNVRSQCQEQTNATNIVSSIKRKSSSFVQITPLPTQPPPPISQPLPQPMSHASSSTVYTIDTNYYAQLSESERDFIHMLNQSSNVENSGNNLAGFDPFRQLK